MFCPAFGKGGTFRGREIHNTWIISFCTVNSSCAKSHYQAQHTVGSIDRIISFISTVRVADTCSIWHEKIFVHRSGYTLDQKRHLFIFEAKSALPAVFQSGRIRSAGIYGADRIFQFRCRSCVYIQENNHPVQNRSLKAKGFSHRLTS